MILAPAIPERAPQLKHELLEAHDEVRLGRQIQENLRRLRVGILTDHDGLRWFTTRLEEVDGGKRSVRTLVSGDQRFPFDALKQDLAWLQTTLRRRSRKIPQANGRLERYRVRPEVLAQCARELLLQKRRPQLRAALQAYEEARQEMCVRNLRLVLSTTTRFRGQGVVGGDLFQEGILGLLRAIDRFDPNRGIRFATYALHWIRLYLSKAVESERRAPSGREDLVTETVEVAPELPDEREELRDRLDSALGFLPERERYILEHYFGLSGPHQTYEQLGQNLGISRERTRQLKERALSRIRQSDYAAELAHHLDLEL
jgi:RNA polymerase sigma factor (sigma-70 family)